VAWRTAPRSRFGGAIFAGPFRFDYGVLFIWRGCVIAPIVGQGCYDIVEITRHDVFRSALP
jgi:hypothetical protein